MRLTHCIFLILFFVGSTVWAGGDPAECPIQVGSEAGPHLMANTNATGTADSGGDASTLGDGNN